MVLQNCRAECASTAQQCASSDDGRDLSGVAAGVAESGWASTAYRNYLVGLFEGLLSSEGDAAGDRYGRLFCLPPERGRGSLAETFEWMEIELNNVVAKAQPNTYVARIFVTHLATSYPCKS